MPNTKRLTLASVVLSLVVASSCGDDDTSSDTSADSGADATVSETTAVDTTVTAAPTTAPSTATPTTATSEVRVVEHALGTSEVPANPQRIVSMDSIVTLDGLVALDAVDSIVGRVNISGGDNPYWLDVDVESIPLLGTWPTLSTEEILSVEPDLVTGFQVAIEALDQAANEVVPLVAVAPTSGVTNPRWQDVVVGLGAALGKEADAEALIADYDAALDATVAELPEGFADRTVLVLLGQAGMTGTAMGPSAAPAELFDRLGLVVSPELDGQGDFVPLVDELVPDLQADVVVMLDFDAGATDWDAVLAELPTYAANDSIAQGVSVVDGSLWLNSGPIGQRQLLDEIVEVLAP
ncbi:MAG: ABC transporter substrate-binding protein [Actinomycetota bacterium]